MSKGLYKDVKHLADEFKSSTELIQFISKHGGLKLINRVRRDIMITTAVVTVASFSAGYITCKAIHGAKMKRLEKEQQEEA